MSQDHAPCKMTCDEWLAELQEAHPAVGSLYSDLLRRPTLSSAARDLARAYAAITSSLEKGGALYLCGNGGSFSDALHISGELLKSFVRSRPLPRELEISGIV